MNPRAMYLVLLIRNRVLILKKKSEVRFVRFPIVRHLHQPSSPKQQMQQNLSTLRGLWYITSQKPVFHLTFSEFHLRSR